MRVNLPLFLALNYIETGQEMSHAITLITYIFWAHAVFTLV